MPPTPTESTGQQVFAIFCAVGGAHSSRTAIANDALPPPSLLAAGHALALRRVAGDDTARTAITLATGATLQLRLSRLRLRLRHLRLGWQAVGTTLNCLVVALNALYLRPEGVQIIQPLSHCRTVGLQEK
jgi:hypothetical protein